MNLTQEKIFGYIGSLIFCAIMFLILWLSVLKTIIPQGEQGLLVNFGNVNEASGMFEPMGNNNSNKNSNNNNNVSSEPSVPEVPVRNTPSPSSKPQPIITQNTEQTVSIDAENKRKEEEKRKQEQLQAQEEQRRQQAISNQVAGAFGIGTDPNSTGQGTGVGQGNQGSPQGNSDRGANSGVGSGYGDFSLSGRSLSGSLPRPAYSIQEEGVIVIDITVNKNGSVISAIIGKGTNIDNASMRQSALEAARKAKFNTISGNENQSGKITYRYYLK